MKKIFLFFLFNGLLFAQTDTTKYQWPVSPLNASHNLNATFGEFRNTLSSDHFHNGVDIGEPDGNPVYPCVDGTIYYFIENGIDSYVNVKSIINGKKKHFTYYHVKPNPSLYVGQPVTKGQTIIGTIYQTAGHVHLIERQFLDQASSSIGTEINPVRPEGGLSPFTDIYPPVIESSTLKFYYDKSSVEVPSNQLNGKIDIRIKVREVNGTTSSNINNGTYILGYRILSEDGNQVIFEPEDYGVKYRFYFLPSNSYVHNAFVKNVATLSNPVYWLTNGNGESQINSDLTIPNNYLNTDLLNEGNYLLEIFSEDTRGNSTSKKFPIAITKLPPVLKTVLVKNDSIFFSWDKYISNNLKGYKIYYSPISEDNWKLAADENSLNNETMEIKFSGSNKFLNPTNENLLKYYLVSVDSNGTESIKSDTYSTYINPQNTLNTLIVDGLDRYGNDAEISTPSHDINLVYAQSGIEKISKSISSCANDAITDEEINLNNYDLIIWFCGDESTIDNTFKYQEQAQFANYLENGGKFLVTGSNIGQDLDTKHSNSEDTDTLFYHQFLKSKLMHDGLDLLFELHGESNSIFDGFYTTFYDKAPDDIEPINGAVPILNYNYEYIRDDGEYRKGGIAYTGTFGDSSNIGQLVYLSFPYETIIDTSKQTELIQLILQYFDLVTDVSPLEDKIPNKFNLEQNYPNPFNPTTTIRYSVPGGNDNINFLQIVVYDILGRKIATLVNAKQKPGNYQINFNANNLSSGIYYYQLKTDSFVQTKKMILIK